MLWRGQAAGQLAGGGPFSPRVRLLGELGPAAARERAARRLEAFVAAEAGRRLPSSSGWRRRSPTGGSRAWRAASPIGWSSRRRARPQDGGGRCSRAQPGRAAGAEGSGRALRRLQPLPARAVGARGADRLRRLRRIGAARLAAGRRTLSTALPRPAPPPEALAAARSAAPSPGWPRRSRRWSGWTRWRAPQPKRPAASA